MPSLRSRRDVLRACGAAFGIGTAGCLGGSPLGDDAGETTETSATDRSSTAQSDATRSTATLSASTSTSTQSTTAGPTTIPASTVSDDEAKERALAAEKAYLRTQLKDASCLENWGTAPTTASKRATVAGRTADGVRVELQHPYSYSTGDTHADGASRATYLVTAEDEQRVEGDSISPC